MKHNLKKENISFATSETALTNRPFLKSENENSRQIEIKNDASKISLIQSFWLRLQVLVIRFLEHKYYTTTILCLATWTIFASDTKNLITSVKYDYIFDGIMSFILCSFINEFILNLIFRDGYTRTFYCLFDLISFTALFPDVPIMWNLITTL